MQFKDANLKGDQSEIKAFWGGDSLFKLLLLAS